MTITLSPETEADIRELASLWGFDVGDEYALESVARGVLKDGLREFIKARRKRNAEQAIPQSIPDARVFEEKPVRVTPDGTEWANANGERFVWREGRDGKWIPLPEREEGGSK